MNAVHSLTIGKSNYKNNTIPISEYYINHPNDETQKRSKAIEGLIEKYSIKLSNFQQDKKRNDDDYLLLRSDYEDLLEDIRRISMPNKYIGLMSWLVNRCFMMTPNMISNRDKIQSRLSKNRPLLLKILYDLNPNMLLKCFKKG